MIFLSWLFVAVGVSLKNRYSKYLASLNCFPLCIKFQFIIDMKLQETMQVFSNV